MSSISSVGGAAAVSLAVTQAVVAKPAVQAPKQSPAPEQSTGLDSDGDHDGGRIDTSA
jgi:hypothetical protein